MASAAPVDRLLLLLSGHAHDAGGPSAEGSLESLADGVVPKASTPSRLRAALMGAYGRATTAGPQLDPSVREALAGRHILIAEDNEVNQQAAREMLEQEIGRAHV